METWFEDTCVVCNHNDTNYLDDACDECTETWNNWADSTEYAKFILDLHDPLHDPFDHFFA